VIAVGLRPGAPWSGAADQLARSGRAMGALFVGAGDRRQAAARCPDTAARPRAVACCADDRCRTWLWAYWRRARLRGRRYWPM